MRQSAKNKQQDQMIINLPSQLVAGSLTRNVLPRTLRVRHRYAETFALNTGVAGVVGTVQVMRLNSLFDPNFTGTGHQPYGFDQMVQFFQKYLVLAARYTLVCTGIGGTSDVAVCLQTFPSVGGTTISGITVDAATEKQVCSVFPVVPYGPNRTREVTGEVRMHDLFGITPQQYRDQYEQFGAVYTANPTQTAFLEVGTASWAGVAAEGLYVQIIIDYDTEWSAPVTLTSS